MRKERFDWLLGAGLIRSSPGGTEKVAELINILISALYIPVEGDLITHTDSERIRIFGIQPEPINWGDLKCIEVKRFDDGTYWALVDEASPGDCHTFCNYIERFMSSWGWQVRVETDW